VPRERETDNNKVVVEWHPVPLAWPFTGVVPQIRGSYNRPP
jgi:hypothetical protein